MAQKNRTRRSDCGLLKIQPGGVTPAIEAGVSEKLWEVSNVVALIPEEAPKKRGSYKKRVTAQ